MSRQAEYYHRNKERINASTKRRRTKPPGRALVLLASCRGRARKRELAFDLDKDWIQQRLERGCELTGLSFDFHAGPREAMTPSVDRIDSSKGYTKENCRVIVWALNAAFGTWGMSAFRDISLTWHERNTAKPEDISFMFMAA